MDIAGLAAAIRKAEKVVPVKSVTAGMPLGELYRVWPEQVRNNTRCKVTPQSSADVRFTVA